MNWGKNLQNLNDNIEAAGSVIGGIIHNIGFLIYSIVYELNSMFYYISRALNNNAISLAIALAITLTLFEFYIATATLTAMTFFTSLLITLPAAALIWFVISHTSQLINEYYLTYWKGKYLTKLKAVDAPKPARKFIRAVTILIALAIFMLTLGAPIINLILPVVAFILKDAVLGLSVVSQWSLYIAHNTLHTALLGLQHGGSEDIMAVIVIFAIPFYIIGATSFMLAAIISYLGHAYATYYLASLIVLAPILYGIYQDQCIANAQENKLETSISHHLLLQLALLAKSATAAALCLLTLNFLTPALTALIAPYATYLMVIIGSIALALKLFPGEDNVLSAACLAIVYAATVCFLSLYYSVAFVLAPQLFGIILAIGIGIIGAEIISRTTGFMVDSVISHCFADSALAKNHEAYQEFVNSCAVVAEPVQETHDENVIMAEVVHAT